MADQPPRQPHDQHQRRVMAIAAVAVIVLLAAMIYVAQMIIAQQKIERCLASGRRDCLQIETPPRADGAQEQR
ncbi:MAG: hypothetical protein KDJ29_15380 [Hyphomicrobiales bacterium]|nr:hypothetical protein [Hyphomicrobiales bacterium]